MAAGRILLAGVAGGVAMFIWSSIAHVVLPISSTGVSQISNGEPALLAQMHDALGQSSGLYLFPSLGSGERAAAMKDYESKLAANPSGLLIYHPPGQKALTPSQLITEFLAEVLEALLAVVLLVQTRLTGYAARVGFVLTAGILASLPTNISYWNWYGFPTSYTGAYMAMQVIGFLAAGLAAAALIPRPAIRPAAPAA